MNLNNLVKIKVDDNGEKKRSPKWCLVDPCSYQGSSNLCTHEYFGIGESACVYETKVGKITCPECIRIIKTYQKIKL
jgi:hypothetical protein